jgi:REP element-mobilizing transposase RayT
VKSKSCKRIGQGEFAFRGHGGPRKGAGRKLPALRPMVSHRKREVISGREPVHVTVRLIKGLPSLRRMRVLSVLKVAFAAGCDRFGFRLVQWSVLSNHIHFIVEAEDNEALSKGMQGLQVRVARALNKLWGRKGRVFSGRFHARVLRTPREVRNALVYVLQNARRHGLKVHSHLDAYASGFWFSGWKEGTPGLVGDQGPLPLARARTWLLKTGWWQRHGLIGQKELPLRRAA